MVTARIGPFYHDDIRRQYDQHWKPVFEGERARMSRGRLVKARYPDREPPNTFWVALQLGNCHVCRHFLPHGILYPECRNPAIALPVFQGYLWRTGCPGYAFGPDPALAEGDEYERRRRDVMAQLGLLDEKPPERVEILQDVPWTPWRSFQADNQNSFFDAIAYAKATGCTFTHWDEGKPDEDPGPIDTSE